MLFGQGMQIRALQAGQGGATTTARTQAYGPAPRSAPHAPRVARHSDSAIDAISSALRASVPGPTRHSMPGGALDTIGELSASLAAAQPVTRFASTPALAQRRPGTSSHQQPQQQVASLRRSGSPEPQHAQPAKESNLSGALASWQRQQALTRSDEAAWHEAGGGARHSPTMPQHAERSARRSAGALGHTASTARKVTSKHPCSRGISMEDMSVISSITKVGTISTAALSPTAWRCVHADSAAAGGSGSGGARPGTPHTATDVRNRSASMPSGRAGYLQSKPEDSPKTAGSGHKRVHRRRGKSTSSSKSHESRQRSRSVSTIPSSGLLLHSAASGQADYSQRRIPGAHLHKQQESAVLPFAPYEPHGSYGGAHLCTRLLQECHAFMDEIAPGDSWAVALSIYSSDGSELASDASGLSEAGTAWSDSGSVEQVCVGPAQIAAS